MKVVLGALGASFLAALIACSGAAPQSSTQSDGVSGTNGPGLNPTASSSASSTPAASAPATDAGVVDTDAATDTTAATPQTCDTLATAAATPAGQLQVTSARGINPVDVYATQDDQLLTIVLTETANECGYRLNNLAHASMNEVRIMIPTPQGPGTFQPTETESEQGQVCFPQDGNFGNQFGGTAVSGGTARGKVTITAIDASSVTGTVDVTDFNGRETAFSFTAPICPGVSQQQTQAATCCADPNQQ